MKKTLFLLLIVCGSAHAQSLGLNLSAKSHPSQFLYPEWILDNSPHWPVLQAEACFNLPLENDYWQWQVALLYRQTRIVRELSALVFPDQVDPNYGFVRGTQDPALPDDDWHERYQWLGVSSGMAYTFNPRQKKHQFLLAMGLQFHLPMSATTKIGDNEPTPIFDSEHLMTLAFYGAYLRPVYQLKLGRNGRSPWAINLFADVDVLFRNQAGNNPHFSAGGGLGCTYNLKK